MLTNARELPIQVMHILIGAYIYGDKKIPIASRFAHYQPDLFAGKQKICDLVWGQIMRKVELHPSQLVFLCPARKALVLGSPVNVAFSGHLVEDTGGLAEKPLQRAQAILISLWQGRR